MKEVVAVEGRENSKKLKKNNMRPIFLIISNILLTEACFFSKTRFLMSFMNVDEINET